MGEDTVEQILGNTATLLAHARFAAEDSRDRILIDKYIAAIELLQKAAFAHGI